MAITAELIHADGQVYLDLAPDMERPRIARDPELRMWPFYFYFEGETAIREEDQLLAIEVLDTATITDEWLAELEKLDLPRVDVAEAGLTDVSIADVLRWARDTFPSRYSGVTA